METVIHRGSDRGFANHGWLKAHHSFSFGNYHNSEKMHFGKLRVLNDDFVAPGRGFDTHPHQDMEIITIPLSGALKHGDDMGNEGVINAGEVQIMSAGTGVRHSEHNASEAEDLNLFQIWIFTDERGHPPRYDQKKFSPQGRQDQWQLLVSSDGRNDSLWMHQNAFISRYDTQNSTETAYTLHAENNGVYFMLISGSVEIEGAELDKRDAAGFWSFNEALHITFKERSSLLAIEVPMK